ncbi:hypothetical protein P7F88_25000 [Vibrio hannami]|uniref:hypothetical protein n=1 Tax=Vibrio hannami TaxID=2717094 RepID=UPI002410AC87|nr:hypothetical protein [Vibrio hannami]MDG3089122.1 hypothetical protein [Vibrio hannami]
MDLEESLDAAFGQSWILGEKETDSAITVRYFFRDKKHILRGHDGELEKGTILTNPKGKVFEVVDSYQVTTERFEHVLQVKAEMKSSRTQWSTADV